MKKTLLALFVATSAISTSAMATTVYQQGDATLDVYGRFGALFDKSEKTNIDLKDDDSRIGFKVNYDLGNQLQALGGVEFRFSDAEKRFSDPTTHDAYVGLKHLEVGTLTVGRQATTADDLALSKYAYHRENITSLPTAGDRTVKFRSVDLGNDQFGRLSFGLDYTFMGTNNKDDAVKSKSLGGGLFYTHQLGDIGFKFNGGYAQTTLSDEVATGMAGTSKTTKKDWMVGSELSYQQFALAFDYAHSDERAKDVVTGVTSPSVRTNAFQVAAKYAVSPETNVFTAYQYGKEKSTDALESVNEKYNQYTLGVDHKLHKNVVGYAQVDVIKATDKTTGEKASDVGGAVGLRVYF